MKENSNSQKSEHACKQSGVIRSIWLVYVKRKIDALAPCDAHFGKV